MSGIDFILADTNVLIYLQDGQPAIRPYLNSILYISIITEVEFLGTKDLLKSEIKIRESLIKDCAVLPFDEEIKDIAIRIKQSINLKIPDAIIATTAIKHKLPLLTGDKDFKKVTDLSLIIVEL